MTLQEMQKSVYENKINKRFNVTDVNEEFNHIYGEVAEAYDAWWKSKSNVGEELADVAIYLMGLAEILHIDLQSEIESKIVINKSRKIIEVNGHKLKSEDEEELDFLLGDWIKTI